MKPQHPLYDDWKIVTRVDGKTIREVFGRKMVKAVKKLHHEENFAICTLRVSSPSRPPSSRADLLVNRWKFRLASPDSSPRSSPRSPSRRSSRRRMMSTLPRWILTTSSDALTLLAHNKRTQLVQFPFISLSLVISTMFTVCNLSCIALAFPLSSFQDFERAGEDGLRAGIRN